MTDTSKLIKEAEAILNKTDNLAEFWNMVSQPWIDGDMLPIITANDPDPHKGDFVCDFACELDFEESNKEHEFRELQFKRANLASYAPTMRDLIQRLLDVVKEREFTEEVSENISQHILGHLRLMYPEQYKLFTPSMKKSMKGCIINAWNFHIKQLPPKPEAGGE